MSGNIKTFKTTDACAKCKGACCKNMGCHYSPKQFSDLSFDGLKAEIEKGRISIDWWEGDYEPEYYLRARHVASPIVDPSWGGRCMNLTETGCNLSWEERPLGGKALKPDKSGRCFYTTYSKEDCKNEWLPYGDVLQLLREHFESWQKDGRM